MDSSGNVNEAFEEESIVEDLANDLVNKELTRITIFDNNSSEREENKMKSNDENNKNSTIQNQVILSPTATISSLNSNQLSDSDSDDQNQKTRSISFASSSLNLVTTASTTISDENINHNLYIKEIDNKERIMTMTKDDVVSNLKRDENFTISWNNLDYVVSSNWYELRSERKPILNSLSGSFKSGQLSAVLGPSGAGKSTLIDCLMGKRLNGLSGKTRVSFLDKNVEFERRKRRPLKIATIPQDDHLMDSLTVMETFMFASKIKNAHLNYEDEQNRNNIKKNKKKPFDHFANVQKVIQQLNLSSCSNLRCNSLSGGQYKRVSIGQELLSRPDLMILDEPTSGLDSVTCYQTIKALRTLIETSPYPMAIVATIHQPDIEVFELFHKAYVLASGGRAIYEGPTNMILETVLETIDNLELKRKEQQLSSQLLKLSSSIDNEKRDLKLLKSKLENNLSINKSGNNNNNNNATKTTTTTINPARLIVELAANEYGFEITNAMNELQLQLQSKEQFNFHNNNLLFSTTTLTDDEIIDNNNKKNSNSSSILMATPSTSTTNFSIITTETTTTTPILNIKPSYGPPKPPSNYYSNNNKSINNSNKADLDKLLSLVQANVNQRRSFKVFIKHLLLHCHRSWLTIVRDPMLFSLQVLLHILVPLLISYSFQGYRGDACPKIGPLDVINEAYRYDNGNILDDLQRELRVVFENLGYMFFQIYVIIFAAVCVTSLTYPLIMHVLLKEYRNGWYSMSSYFIGRTLADLPVPTFNVFLAMAISYHLTGQPLSPYGWRFLSVATITVLATLVAQTQGLMFGALLMNMPQSAVFVAPASTAPLVVVSGFLIRIQSLPQPLQILSNFSYFTHLLNGFIISRYGFNRCPCNSDDFSLNENHVIPNQTRSLMNIWVDTFAQDYPLVGAYNTSSSSSSSPAPQQVDLVGKLVDTITKAKTFGYEITNCDQVKPFTMLDYQLNDSDLTNCFIILIAMLFAFRWLTYITLSWKIGSSI